MKLIHKLVMLLAAIACFAATAGTVTYYHNDFAGSPIAATNASGQVIWREDYRPYGERLTNAPAAADNKVWFTSRRQDPETGLVYMGARFYDPVAGRFLSKDPVHFVEDNVHSFNRYAYANNNPYRYKDPTGAVAESIWDLASFALSVGLFRNDPSLANFAGAVVDGIALAVPFVPGGVGAIRAVGSAGDTLSASVPSKVDFIVTKDGAAVHASPQGLRASLEGAGMSGRSVTNAAGTETGTLHNVPGMRMDIRVMDGGSHHPARAVTSREGTSQPVNPATGGNFGNIPKADQRTRSHIPF